MPNSTYERRRILNQGFRDEAATKHGTLYLALASADLTADNVTANELPIGTGGYARIAIPTTNADWTAPATVGGREMISNVNTLTGGTASANLNGGTAIPNWGLYDASTGGNLIKYGTFGTPRSVLSGDPIEIAPGAIQFFQT